MKLGFLKFPFFHILSDSEDCLSDRLYMMGREVGVGIYYVTILWQLKLGSFVPKLK